MIRKMNLVLTFAGCLIFGATVFGLIDLTSNEADLHKGSEIPMLGQAMILSPIDEVSEALRGFEPGVPCGKTSIKADGIEAFEIQCD